VQAFAGRYGLAGVAGAIVLLLVGAAAAWAGGYVGILAERVDNSVRRAAVGAGFEVRRVTLMGRREASVEEIEAAVGPVVGGSILHVDLEDARRRIENLGWVRSAAVSRLLPDTIHVSIRERTPAAVWQLSGQLHLIDEAGAIIRSIKADQYPDLPLVVGAGASEAAADILKELASRPEIAGMTSSLTRVSDRRWNLRLRSGVDVMMPEGDLEEAFEVLTRLLDHDVSLDRTVEYIDLRNPERLTAHPKGEPAPPAP
jgi:cell division protein FtsQ